MFLVSTEKLDTYIDIDSDKGARYLVYFHQIIVLNEIHTSQTILAATMQQSSPTFNGKVGHDVSGCISFIVAIAVITITIIFP